MVTRVPRLCSGDDSTEKSRRAGAGGERVKGGRVLLAALYTEFSMREEGGTEMFLGSSCRERMLRFHIFALFLAAFRAALVSSYQPHFFPKEMLLSVHIRF